MKSPAVSLTKNIMKLIKNSFSNKLVTKVSKITFKTINSIQFIYKVLTSLLRVPKDATQLFIHVFIVYFSHCATQWVFIKNRDIDKK